MHRKTQWSEVLFSYSFAKMIGLLRVCILNVRFMVRYTCIPCGPIIHRSLARIDRQYRRSSQPHSVITVQPPGEETSNFCNKKQKRPTNAANLQSMQFTTNIVKLLGTMSQHYYQWVSNYFGINTIKELIHNRFEKFRISYGAVWYLLDAELILTLLYIYFFLFSFFLATVFGGEIELYINLIAAVCNVIDAERSDQPVHCE